MRLTLLPLFLILTACGDKGDDTGGDGGGGDTDTDTDTDDTGDTAEPVDADGDGIVAEDDCDDDDATVFPGAPEICDGIDNDCDGFPDDEDNDTDLSTGTTWYTDADADGYGDPETGVDACAAPAGTVDNGDDCDDAAAGVNPGAAEVCDEAGVDEDCSGAANEADHGMDPAELTTFYADADADGYGDAAVSVDVCFDPSTEGDAWVAGESSDCDDAAGTVYPGAPTVCGDGQVNDCGGTQGDEDSACDWATSDLLPADATARIVGDHSGFARTLAHGDFDGDGLDELAIGAAWADGTRGAAYIYEGDGLGGTLDMEADGITVEAADRGDELGWGLAALPDVDGDGADELLLGAPSHASVATDGGAVYLLAGPVTGGTAGTLAAASWTTSSAGALLGSGLVAAGDHDGDGVADILAGAVGYDATGTGSTGAVYLLSGAGTGSQDADTVAVAKILGTDTAARLGSGRSMAGTSDLDGDGTLDVVVGAPALDGDGSDAGVVYVHFGPLSGSVSVADADAWVGGGGDLLGLAVATGADLDGDGSDDLVVGDPSYSGAAVDQGGVFVFSGPVSGALDVGSGASLAILGEAGSETGGTFDLDDFDGDGSPDLLTGSASWFFDGGCTTTSTGTGTEAWLFLGPTPGTLGVADADVSIDGGDAAFGRTVRFAGDLTGDGQADLAVLESGAPTDEQTAWIYLAPGF